MKSSKKPLTASERMMVYSMRRLKGVRKWEATVMKEEMLHALRQSGLTLKEISALVGIGVPTLSDYLKFRKRRIAVGLREPYNGNFNKKLHVRMRNRLLLDKVKTANKKLALEAIGLLKRGMQLSEVVEAVGGKSRLSVVYLVRKYGYKKKITGVIGKYGR